MKPAQLISKKKNQVTQAEIVMEYFLNNPNRDIEHPEIVDWVTTEYKKRTRRVFRDPDRQIRQLHQKGILQKIRKGVYRYDPALISKIALEEFTPTQKEAILKRDNYRCVICGLGLKDGQELHVDHIKPKDFGGKATLENGQTLCSKHNNLKKNYKQTETGKKMFIRLYNLAKSSKDKELQRFCEDVLKIYESHNINDHIKWSK